MKACMLAMGVAAVAVAGIFPVESQASGVTRNVPTIVWTKPLMDGYKRYAGWPTALRTSNGEILVSFSGDREAHVCPYGKVQLVRSKDDGETWSDPETICNCAIDDRDAGVLELKNRDLVLFWFTSLAFFEYPRVRSQHPEYVKIYNGLTDDTKRMLLGSWSRRSSDGGKTWSQPVRVPVMTPHGGKQLKDGRILVVGIRNRQTEGQLTTDPNCVPQTIEVVESADGGRSFKVISTIPPLDAKCLWAMSEPTLYERDDGTLVALIRYELDSDGKYDLKKAYPRYLLRSESNDGGKTWSKMERSNINGFPPHVLRLKDGRFLCSYAGRWGDHIGIYAMLSFDGGETWDAANEIELYKGKSTDLGYSSTVENDDGTLLTVFYACQAKGTKPVLMGVKWRCPL